MRNLFFIIFLLKVSQISGIANKNGGEMPVGSGEGRGKSSLAFVFDTTGSMYNDLKQLREGAEMILNTALEENGIIGDFVFVPFHDPAVGPATVTRDKQEFKKALEQVEVYGGGDCPEKSLGGIQLALSVSEERSFIYVFTDATAGDHRLVGKVLDTLQRKQTQVVFVLTGHCNDLDRPSYKVYQQIAAASFGQVFNLNKTNVHKVLDFVRSSIKGRSVNLGSSVNPPGYNYSQGIPVDSTVGEVTVSVSGAEPHITVVSPSGEQLTGPPQLITTLDLAEIMVVKVIQPEVGNWSITVGSSEPHSVKVVGLSNVTFNHGFSVHPTKSMADTTYRPLEGTYNHMMISVTGSEKPVHIDYAEILTLSGDTLFELPLKQLDRDVYIADAFLPPDDFFYIAINGKDEHNQELRRIGTTAVQAKLPDVPYLSAPRKVTAHSHSRVVLKCKVESLVPVTAMWMKNTAKLHGQVSSIQTTSIEYIIEDMTEEDVATYRCVGKNVAGVSRAATDLVLLVDPPQISMEPTKPISLEKGDNATISCTVFSEALLLKFQIVSVTNDSYDVLDVAVEPNIEGVYSYNLTVQDATEYDAGNYTCIAANREMTPAAKTFLLMQVNQYKKKKQRRRFSTEEKIFALSLSKQSPKGYKFLENIFVLPSKTTLNKFSKNFSINCGLNNQLLKMFQEITKEWEIEKKMCSIVFDEVALTPHLTFVESQDVIEGFVNYGQKKELKFCDHALVIMIRGVCSSWTQPIAYYLCEGSTPALTLKNILRDVVDAVAEIGLIPKALMCDQGSTFRSCMNSFFNDMREQQLRNNIEPDCCLEISGHKLHLIYDPPHLIKAQIKEYQGNKMMKAQVRTQGPAQVPEQCFSNLLLQNALAFKSGTSNKTAEIHIQTNPMAQIVGPHDLTIKQHDIATLHCTVNNSYAISWAKNGTVVKEVAVDDSFTDFLEVNVTDDGNWTCIAKRGSHEASDTIHISMQIKPQVTIEGSKNITVLNGTTHELICRVVAKPEPRILWYRGAEESFLNHTITPVDNKTYRSTLLLNSSVQNIEGTYFCVGENPEGIHEDNVIINVRRGMKVLQVFNDTSVQLYSEIILNCDVDSFPLPKITWLHNNTVLISTPNTIISENNKTLDIRRVDFANLGLYSCEVDNGFEKIEVNGSLTVHGLESPVLLKEPAQRIAREGDSTLFTCRVLTSSPEPTVKWQYRSKTSSSFITLHNSSKLSIHNVAANNSGTYRCEAENVIGKDVYDVELVVQYPPQLKTVNNSSAPQKPLEINAGSSVKFSCEAVGTPTPIVLWSKDGRSMVYGKHVHLTEVNDLVIDKVTEYDSGLFTCNVTNPMGSVQKNFTLVVYVLPAISEPNAPAEQEFLEGQLVELPCKATGVPSPSVIWQHNGDLVNDTRKYIDEFGIRFVANLTDFGDYTCIAENQYGNTTLKYSLFIWVPPYIDPPLEEVKTVLKGSNVSLQCDVIGFPLPSIVWEFRDEALQENTTDLSFNDIGNIYLTNTTSHHEGPYACIAENIAGVARKIIHLKLHEPPKILDENYTGPYLATDKDSALTISCRTTGKPKPYVAWIKDDFYLDKDARYEVQTDGKLTLKYPTGDMSGNYTCMAKNVVGVTNKTVEVMVYSLPTQMQAEESHPTITVLEHTNTRLECPTRASHTDTVKWYKDAALVSTGKLQIPRVSRNDQSTYACVVTNAVGSAYSAINLNIEWPPKFIDNAEDDLVEYIDDNKNKEVTYNNEREITNDVQKQSSSAKGSIDFGNIGNATEASDLIETLRDRESAVKSIKVNDISNTEDKIPMKRVDRVEKREKVVEVIMGEDTFMDCSVDAKPLAKTKWYFNSKPIVFENKEKLKVLNVQARNSGSYKCVVGNSHGTIVKEFKLQVLELPFISEFDTMDVLLMEGSEATLECNAKGTPEPNLHWTYNNSNWHTINSSLTVTNITSQSEGIYRCDAANKAGATHIVYNVSVVSGAKVTDVVMFSGANGTSVGDLRVVEAKKGTNIRMSCNTKGKPTPIVRWLRNGKVLSENLQGISYADLKLDGVSSSQNGAYTCVATNEGGSDEKKIRLEVLEPPTIFQTILESNNSGNTINLEVLSGQAYYLHCHTNGNPAPETYWFRDGLPLMLFDDSMISTDFGEVIQVRRAMQEQSGNYTCVARNKVGNTSIVYLVDVLVPPPQPKEASKPVTTRVGKTLTLKCPVQGSPVPNVMWHKHPYTEIGTNTTRVQLLDDGVTLVINKSQVSDSGNYSCTMTNKVGTTEIIFDVTIEKPPSIAGTNEVENHVVMLGKSLVLKCDVDGHPLPKITWLKDTQQLASSSNVHRTLGDSLLGIWSVRAREAGRYICVAESRAGAAHRRYRVAVSVPGKWSQWQAWSYCNVTCGLGYQIRTRSCQYIDDNNVTIDKSSKSDLILDESACKGPADEKRKCNMPPCEEGSPSGWSVWSRWSACSASCGAGSQARTRRCRHDHCVGDNVQIRKCPGLPKCESGTKIDNVNKDNNAFTPEAVFEVQPEIVEPQYSTDVEEFYLDTESKSSIWYDVEVTENLDGSSHGPCQPGYRINHNGTCQDIDECESAMNQCHATQVCGNTAGGYRCSCAAGLTSLGAGQRCMDVNECSQGTAGCEYACVNVVRGYVCACPAHMRLAPDRHSCYVPGLHRKPYEYEDTSEYLSASIEYPARYKHNRN